MLRPFLWAHRGASALAPENTMAAFSLAAECGADGLELDVHLSRDGIAVVIHDETLDRTTDGAGYVASFVSQDIQRLDAGRWFDSVYAGELVPLLGDVLKVFSGKLTLNLEIKDFHAGQEVLAALRKTPGTDIVVSSFDSRVLEQLRTEDSVLPLAVLYAEGSWRRSVGLAKELSARSFHPIASAVTRPMLAFCRQLGLPVHVWTVDEPSRARSLFRAGVSGIFTNNPLLLGKAFFAPGLES